MCFKTGEITTEWQRGVIVPIGKGKGDIHDLGRYRGITLRSQSLKLMERILDARVRHIVHCAERPCICSHEMDGGQRGRGQNG